MLGLTYKAGDWADLRYQFERLVRRPENEFEASIRRFVGYFSREQTYSALSLAVSNAGPGAKLPGLGTPISEAVSGT